MGGNFTGARVATQCLLDGFLVQVRAPRTGIAELYGENDLPARLRAALRQTVRERDRVRTALAVSRALALPDDSSAGHVVTLNYVYFFALVH